MKMDDEASVVLSCTLISRFFWGEEPAPIRIADYGTVDVRGVSRPAGELDSEMENRLGRC
jgi:hypothetical protein